MTCVICKTGTPVADKATFTSTKDGVTVVIRDVPVVMAVNHEYADAGATVHTTNTFRTRRRAVGDRRQRGGVATAPGGLATRLRAEASATGPAPSTAARMMSRAKPVSRDSSV